MHAGHDEAFIDRTMPALTITVPLISANCVQVAQDSTSEVVGVVLVTPTSLQGIAQLDGLFVDPAHWKRGIGRVLFGAAVARAKRIKAGALMITAEPSAEGFYKRMGAIRIGEGPFNFSPETILPSLPRHDAVRGGLSSAYVQVFGCRDDGLSTHSDGRRPKSAKAGNRGLGM